MQNYIFHCFYVYHTKSSVFLTKYSVFEYKFDVKYSTTYISIKMQKFVCPLIFYNPSIQWE